MGPAVCALALEEAAWDTGHAGVLLRRFEAANVDKLKALQQVKPGADHMQRRIDVARAAAAPAPGAAAARTHSGAGLNSGSESPEERKSSQRERSRRGRKERRSKRSKRSRDREDRERERDRTSKKAKPTQDGKSQFGKYGILRKSDLANKHSEFQAWAIEVKKANVEALPKWEEEELLAEFMEEFNTATLPHKKYYNLEVYERERAMKAAKRGAGTGDSEKTQFDDEAERRRELHRERADEQAERLRDAYNQLKYTAQDKVQDMREQDMLRMQMQIAYRTGDHDKASKLAERLKPDDQKEQARPE
eukprot:jgi/Astpho2/6242/e_gw1.00088.64.1_t